MPGNPFAMKPEGNSSGIGSLPRALPLSRPIEIVATTRGVTDGFCLSSSETSGARQVSKIGPFRAFSHENIAGTPSVET